MRKALIENTTGLVVNMVEAGADWKPPVGHAVIAPGTGNIGDTWDGAKFVTPPPSPEQVARTKREEARARAITAIKANKTGAPWGVILHDLALAQEWIEVAT